MVQVQVHGELAVITGYPYAKLFLKLAAEAVVD